MHKKVSVIIPCYNQELYIKEAIDSVLNQTYKNIEIICINDASSDGSAKVIREYENLENFICINHTENKGVIFSKNEAIKIAKGEYILPLDGDDTIEPTYTEKAVKILDEHPDIGIVYCYAKLFGGESGLYTPPVFDENKILFSNYILNSSFFRKEDFVNVGGYKDYMKHGFEDWDLWLSFVEKGNTGYLIPEVLFNYRKQITNCRTNNANIHADELYSNILKHHTNLYVSNKYCVDKIFKLPHKLIPLWTKYLNFKKILKKLFRKKV